MRRLSRRRTVIHVAVSLALLFVIYVKTHDGHTKNENKRCLNDSCRDVASVKLQRGVITRLHATGGSDVDTNWSDFTSVSKPIWPNIVVYNRVPKCASSTVRYLIAKLQRKNKFTYKLHNWPNVKQSLTKEDEIDLAQEVASLRPPALFLRHLHFVDFAKYNISSLVYINVIRNPVDRFISHYYFSRHGFVGWTKEKIDKWLWPMPEEKRNMDLDDCVMKLGAVQCVRDNQENMLDFFCGQHKRCKQHDNWSLEQAKENIARNYAFLGTLERLEDSLRVLEVLLPQYFKGATRYYRNGGKMNTKTANKKEPSEKTRAELEKALFREMELYHFVTKRFELQFESFRSSGYIP